MRNFLPLLSAASFTATFFVGSVQASSEHVVKITAQGFEPNLVTIEKGEKITWVNEDNKPHWPASDPHPVHNSYPVSGGCIGSKFDACHGLVRGESFSFVFDKEGSWGVHDHLNPGMLMEVRVGASSGNWWSNWWVSISEKWWRLVGWLDHRFGSGSLAKTAGPSVADFRSMDKLTQEKEVRGLTAQDSKEAWDFLKKAFMENGQVVGNAHSLAHIVGDVIYQHQGIAGVKICDAAFSYGCFHGVTEQALRDHGPTVVTEVEKECKAQLATSRPDNLSGCIHGAGHGLLTWESLNVGKALADCDGFSASVRMYCYDGVFMENASDSPMDFDNKDHWKFCASVAERYQYNCARYEAIGLSNSPNKSSNDIAKICESAPNQTLVKPCLDSIGFKAAQENLGKFAGIRSACDGLDDQGKDECLESAALEVKFQNYGSWQTVARQLCDSVSVEKRISCLSQVGLH